MTSIEKPTILIVDDDRDQTDMLAGLFHAEGYIVHFAYDGAAAVSLAEEVQPDVIIMDLGMPKLTGYEAAKAIREQVRKKEVKLIALSGWDQEEHRRRALDAGFDLHLAKPADFEMLRGLVAALDLTNRDDEKDPGSSGSA